MQPNATVCAPDAHCVPSRSLYTHDRRTVGQFQEIRDRLVSLNTVSLLIDQVVYSMRFWDYCVTRIKEVQCLDMTVENVNIIPEVDEDWALRKSSSAVRAKDPEDLAHAETSKTRAR